jgi:hypothetical protein
MRKNSMFSSTKQHHSNFQNKLQVFVTGDSFSCLCSFLHRKPKKFEFRFDFFCLDGEKKDGSKLWKEKVESFSLFGRDGRRYILITFFFHCGILI